MYILKKIFLGNLVGISAGVPAFLYLSDYFKKQSELEKKNLQHFDKYSLPVLNGENIKHADIFAVFSSNLTSFSEKTIGLAKEEFLFNFVISLFSNSEYSEEVKEVKKIFNDLKNEDFLNWDNKWKYSINTENIWKKHKTKEAIENAFISVFFKKWLIEFKNNEISIKEEATKSYEQKLLAKLQKSFIEYWIQNENPIFLSKKTWNYDTEQSKIFATNTTPNFFWPDIKEDLPEWKTIHTGIKDKNLNIDEKFSTSLYTKDMLSEEADVFLSSALIYIHNRINNLETSSKFDGLDLSNGVFSQEYEKKPIYLFIDKHKENNVTKNCLPIQKDLFSDTIKGKFNDKQPCLFNIRETAYNNDSKNIYFVRHTTGISVFAPQTEEIKKLVLDDLNKTNPISQDVLKKYFHKNLGDVLTDFSFTKNNEKTFLKSFSNKNKLQEVLQYSEKYLKTLNNNKKYYEFLKKFTDKNLELSNTTITTSDNKKYPDKKHGFISPISFDQKIDKTSDVSDINETKTADELKIEISTNNGDFDFLSKYLKIENYKNLYDAATELKDKIKNFCIDLPSFEIDSNGKKFYSFNDEIYDQILHSVFDDETLISKHVYLLKILKYLDIDLLNFSLNKYSEKLSKLLEEKFEITDESKIESYLISNIHKNDYLKDENKMIYGGYKDDEALIKKTKNYFYLKRSFFNDFSYQLINEENEKLIGKLYSAIWLLEQKMNMSVSLGKLLSNSDFFALAWQGENNENIEQETENDITKLKNIEQFFKKTEHPCMFSEFANWKTAKSITNDQKCKKELTANSKAYKEGETDKNLYGFLGLITKEDKSFKESTIKDVFSDLHKFSFEKNKNYLINGDQNKNVIFGTAFAINQNSNMNINTWFDSFENVEKIDEWLKTRATKIYSELSKNVATTTSGTSSIKDLKKEDLIKELSKSINDSNKGYFERFAGFLKSEGNEISYGIKLDNNKNEKTPFYILQLNKYDFMNNSKNLKNFLNEEQIILSLLSIGSHPIVQQTIKENFIFWLKS